MAGWPPVVSTPTFLSSLDWKGLFRPHLVTQCPDVSKTKGDYLSNNDNLSQDAQMPFSRPAPIRLRGCYNGLAAIVISISTAAAGRGLAQEPSEPGPGGLTSCLKAVAQRSGEEISCNYMALLTPEERDDMRRISRGLLQDAHCLVKIRIARAILEQALTAPDQVFQSPPQPVSCNIKTKSGEFPIKATFAPQVTFKEGRAVGGTPGLANVEGINSYLAWPVVAYVNKSARIRDAMLEIINTYKPGLRPAR